MRGAIVLVVLCVAAPAAAAPPRFFVMGTGRLGVESAHSGEHATVTYRGADGAYDPAALARLDHLFRSSDGRERAMSLRLVEMLSHVQQLAGGASLRIVSGYRSPVYNQALRDKGVRAAGGSLHTEGLAADVAFPKASLHDLWLTIRGLECCGAGYYAKEGFLHIDVGRPRFWEPATSRVEENLSDGNARLFARTEYDRYATGEDMVVAIHSLTTPPVRIAREAKIVGEGGEAVGVRVEGALPERDGCLEVGETGARVRVKAAVAVAGKVELATCEPRAERTPESVEGNRVEVR
jgi:uncharacterized protein YcbK (DUF882 family)